MSEECILCSGTGKFKIPVKNNGDDKKSRKSMDKAIRILRDKKFSLRQIQKLVGYKSVRSISVSLERTKNEK